MTTRGEGVSVCWQLSGYIEPELTGRGEEKERRGTEERKEKRMRCMKRREMRGNRDEMGVEEKGVKQKEDRRLEERGEDKMTPS